MIADLARVLHQSISEVLLWDAEHVFMFHSHAADIIEDETPKKGK